MFTRLLRLIALALLAGQAIVVQAHVHGPGRPALGRPAVHAGADHQTPQATAECSACRQAARDGLFVPPDLPGCARPSAHDLTSSASAAGGTAPANRVVPWRSRAPPVRAIA